MSSALGRLYGADWDNAPPPLRRAVAVIVAAAVVSLAISIAITITAAPSAGAAVGLTIFVVVVHLVLIGLAVFLLRRSRVMWLTFVVLTAIAAVVLPDSVWEIPGYVVNIVTLVLLLTPGAVRAVWSGHASSYDTVPDVRRPD